MNTCHVDDPKDYQRYPEMKLFNQQLFESAFTEKCIGKQVCNTQILTNSFLNGKLLTGKRYNLFVQSACTQTEATLRNKREVGLILSTMCILMGLIAIMAFNRMYTSVGVEIILSDI